MPDRCQAAARTLTVEPKRPSKRLRGVSFRGEFRSSINEELEIPWTVRSVLGPSMQAYYLPDYVRRRCGADVDIPAGVELAFSRMEKSACRSKPSTKAPPEKTMPSEKAERADLEDESSMGDGSTNHASDDNDGIYGLMARTIIATHSSHSSTYSRVSGDATVPRGSSQESLRSSATKCRQSLESLVDGVIGTLVYKKEKLKQVQNQKRNKASNDATSFSFDDYGRNVLSIGYTFARDGGSTVGCPNMVPGVQCLHPNTTASYARFSPLMRAIHELVGDDVMRDILLLSIVLVPAGIADRVTEDGLVHGTLQKGNYFQLCGPPLTYYRTREKNGGARVSLHRSGDAANIDESLKPSGQQGQAAAAGGRPGRKRRRGSDGYIDYPISKVPWRDTAVSSTNNASSMQLGDGAGNVTNIPINPYAPSEARMSSQSLEDSDNEDEEDKSAGCTSLKPCHKWEPNAPIPRHRMFYSESFVKKVGLPPSHMLNHIDDGKECGGVHERLLDAMVQLRAYSERGRGRKRRKRWKRLRQQGIELCRDMRRRHNACDYARLLEGHCPLPEICKQQREKPPTLPDLTAAYTSGTQVASFLVSCLGSAFPSAFWGSRHNFSVVTSTVHTFVNLRRREQLPEKAITHGIRVSDMTWLLAADTHVPGDTYPRRGRDADPKRKLSLTNHEAATTLLRNVMRWLYCDYLIPLIRSVFYATESEFTANRVLFYRKPVWTKLRSLAMDGLDQYEEIDALEASQRLSKQRMGFSKLRLLPKKTGIRAIAMLSKRQCVDFQEKIQGSKVSSTFEGGNTGAEGGSRKAGAVGPRLKRPTRDVRYLSTNTILGRTFDVLKHERNLSPEKFGCGVFGFNEVFPLLLDFVNDLRSARSSSPALEGSALDSNPFQQQTKCQPLYFASADLHHCYDNIDQAYLFDLVGTLFSENDYLIQQHSILHPFESMGRVQRKPGTKVGPPESFTKFPKLADEELAQKYSRSVFVDGVNCTVTRKEQILDLLKEHIFSHLVVTNGDFGPRFLSQSSGIPQGSVLSSMLCNYYYGDLERELMSGVFDRPTKGGKNGESDEKAIEQDDSSGNTTPKHIHLLVRIVDDFLLVSTDKGTSVRFLQNMSTGIPRLGVKVNKAKTRVNFDVALGCDEVERTVHRGCHGEEFFAWCGMLFDTKTCETHVDYTRFAGPQAADGLTVDRSGNEGSKLLVRMKSFIRPRCQPILFDIRLNRLDAVEFNFYQAVLLCAVKTVNYTSHGMEGAVARNPAFLVDCINDVILYAHALIFNRLRSVAASNKDRSLQKVSTSSHISRASAQWLGRHAFRSVLRFKGDEYKSVIQGLKKKSGGEQKVKLNYRRLDVVSKKALKEFDMSSFNL